MITPFVSAARRAEPRVQSHLGQWLTQALLLVQHTQTQIRPTDDSCPSQDQGLLLVLLATRHNELPNWLIEQQQQRQHEMDGSGGLLSGDVIWAQAGLSRQLLGVVRRRV